MVRSGLISELRVSAKTISQIGGDSVVPLGQDFVGLDAECLKLFRCRCGAGEIVATVEMSVDR